MKGNAMVKKKSIYPYLLVAPALIIILCVVFIPVVNAIGMSFQSYDLRRPKDIAFCGLENYIEAFSDDERFSDGKYYKFISSIFWPMPFPFLANLRHFSLSIW